MIRINMLSGPRNISTALMYSFAQRADTRVMDEPFYAVYLARSGAEHPARQEVLTTMSQDEAEVTDSIVNATDCEVLYVKNMTHHQEILDDGYLDECVNVFLIRDPVQIIASYAKVIKNPVMRDIGIAYQHGLFKALAEKGRQPVVIDSNIVLQNPGAALEMLCDASGISFDPAMLSWPAGPKPYDGVWAPHWYGQVHASTGFARQSTNAVDVPPHLRDLRDEARTYYEELLPFALKP